MDAMPDSDLATNLAASASREQLAAPISLNIVSPLVAVLDLCWIVLLGIGAGLLYDALARGGYGDAGNYVGSGMAVAMLYSAFAHAAGLYRAPNLLKRRVGRSVLIWVGVFVFLASLAFLLKIGAMFSRGEMLLFFSGGLIVTAASRIAVASVCTYVVASRALAPNRVVLVGSPQELAANDALPVLERYGYSVAAVFQLPGQNDAGLHKEELKERMREVVRCVREERIDEVVLVLPWNRPDVIHEVESELRMLPIPVKLVPDMMTSRVLRHPLFELGPTKAVELQRAPLSIAQRNLKRLMDQILAALGLFVLAPFIAVIAAAIRLETPGPALFLQTRVGFNGRPFRIYKFRTMRARDDGPIVVQATRNDKRITHLGALLRKLSIDEIPQLFNVLRGEMSLVGPRPHALAHDNEYDRLIATYAIRHKMKPGITGWAQVNGYRGETPEVGMMKQRVDSDLWYIEYWSLWLDIRILLLTVVRILKSDNAY
ncbi:undecaprenyl-phosphate glucose phosphotransferase [Bradyrhizobium sp. LHD-71]|uniref:undecaprenyl-phosphate glucose phosphotransferase n=1 Tax=Bradyrhizobium sp. LHD-71 TaxID=3072141 RepID=UPI00280CA023|nr:undecaprenyl-phosphate glucose phosphotransferase [Bradyrhizobium sp. LHD-71]MDQ8728039.1 undecaprenyl-phosphate glucose phosphotransferase [Bradyrhizobium sp. LHD-71]